LKINTGVHPARFRSAHPCDTPSPVDPPPAHTAAY
jgi:hypothetical protein